MAKMLSDKTKDDMQLSLFAHDADINSNDSVKEIRSMLSDLISGCEFIDIRNEERVINQKLMYAKELRSLGLLDTEEITSMYKIILEDFLNIKIWDFFVNKFTLERAGSKRIDRFCELLDWR